jgi:hypothetical protein
MGMCGNALGQNVAAFEIDREVMLRSCPLSGQLLLDFEDGVEADDFPGFMLGGMQITLVCPDGRIRYVNQATVASGDHVDRGLREMRKLSGKYQVPIFLLKDRLQEYFFDELGEYLVRFEFDQIFEMPSIEIRIKVQWCEGCGESEFLSWFSVGGYMYPFNRSMNENGASVPDGPYREFNDIARSYLEGGHATLLFFSSSLTGDICKKVEREGYIIRGASASKRVGVNVELWNYLEQKMAAFDSGNAWSNDQGAGIEGRRLLLVK